MKIKNDICNKFEICVIKFHTTFEINLVSTNKFYTKVNLKFNFNVKKTEKLQLKCVFVTLSYVIAKLNSIRKSQRHFDN